TQGRLLPREARRSDFRQLAVEQLEICLLAALIERELELDLPVEMVLDHALVAAGHENEMLDPGFSRFVDDMLNDGAVNDREHLLGHGLGGGQEAGTEARNRENRLANRGHGREIPQMGLLPMVGGALSEKSPRISRKRNPGRLAPGARENAAGQTGGFRRAG